MSATKWGQIGFHNMMKNDHIFFVLSRKPTFFDKTTKSVTNIKPEIYWICQISQSIRITFTGTNIIFSVNCKESIEHSKKKARIRLKNAIYYKIIIFYVHIYDFFY